MQLKQAYLLLAVLLLATMAIAVMDLGCRHAPDWPDRDAEHYKASMQESADAIVRLKAQLARERTNAP